MEFEEVMYDHDGHQIASHNNKDEWSISPSIGSEDEDWSKPAPFHQVEFLVLKYQQWQDRYKLQFLTHFHAQCCSCNAMQALSQTFQNLGSDSPEGETFFDIDVANMIKQWKLWNHQNQSQFATAIHHINPSLFSQVFHCQSYSDNPVN